MSPTIFATGLLFLTLGPLFFGFFFGFFGFDFPAEFFFFGVFGFAAFAFFVVDFFDRDRAVFAVVRFFGVDGRRGRGGDGQGHRVRRGGCGKQQQRGEQEDQQDREFPHGSLIGAKADLA